MTMHRKLVVVLFGAVIALLGPSHCLAQTANSVARFDANGKLVDSTIVDNGNVGIGTTAHPANLSVQAGAEGQAGPVEAIRIMGPNGPNNSNSAQDLKWSFASAGSASIRAFRGGSWDTYLQFLTNANSSLGDLPQVRMTIDQVGNVGIGTTTPGARLQVNSDTASTITAPVFGTAKGSIHINPTTPGNDSFTGITFGAGDSNARAVQDTAQAGVYVQSSGVYGTKMFFATTQSFDTGAQSRLAIDNIGNVGIGTTTPQAALNVAGAQIQLSDPSQALANYSYLKTSAYTNNTQKLTLGTTYGYSEPVDALTIFNGNVGIGTTSPNAKLEINGGLRFSGDAAGTVQTTAWTGVLCGGDYAESVGVSGTIAAYEPGDVLVVDNTVADSVSKSAEAYSTAVAGIYATKPGVIGRRSTDPQKLKAEVPMAMVGIVPAKVSTENGPIRRGDLLVTSSTPGYLMKGTDRSRMLGAIVGKAWSTLDTGKGIMEVLVSLQ